MNLVIDYGNTRIKLGVFDESELREVITISDHKQVYSFLKENTYDNVIISSVSKEAHDLLMHANSKGLKLELTASIALPIQIHYKNAKTLGVDRIAAACGAAELMPDRDCLVIDMGTCINYEFIDAARNYHGGAISPGVNMRFNAMHTFTARLPLVSPISHAPLTGASTEECLLSGVMNGVLAEMQGIIDRYNQKYPSMGVILCGGDSAFFENKLKQPIFVAPNLVLNGLNRILLHHVSH